MAVAENRLVMNPVDGVELPAVASVEQRFLTLEQLRMLADAAGEHRPLVYVLGTCGLRFGEVAELRWRDLDLQKKQIRIARSVTLVDGVFEIGSPKNGKGRTVSLPAFVADSSVNEKSISTRWCSPTPRVATCGGRTCGGGGGRRPSRPPSCSRGRRRTRRGAITVYDFKLHELRHTAASLAIQAGANIKALAEHARTRVRGPDVGPLRPPVRVGCRGCRGRHQRTFNSKLWSKCGHGDVARDRSLTGLDTA